jgi:hypothetical protein
MSLIDLWENSKGQVEEKHVQQIIAFAGDGQLKDGKEASIEFREFLSRISSNLLILYANQCLENSFNGSGLALQDIVNEVGARLGFTVVSGRYRGISGQIGYDGLWKFPSDHTVIVEVKTTDAYRIDLDTVSNYRKQLIKEETLTEQNSSVLIIVGRKDTGDLEAQIRGSRHAWDMRLISVDALMSLMKLKEEVEDPKTIQKIHDILIPREFTKLDEIIEIIFSTAEDVKDEEPPEDDIELKERPRKFTPVSFHQACIERIEGSLNISLIKKSKASFTTSDKSVYLICAVSKEHERGNTIGYWFAFHPHQKDFLSKAKNGYVAFGCGDKSRILLFPAKEFTQLLENMYTTQKGDRFYWHVHITRNNRDLVLHFKKGNKNINITQNAYCLSSEKVTV